MATLPVEDIQYSEEIEELVYKKLDGSYRGWKVELLVEQITSKLEEKFLLCSYCSGLMRDACLLQKEGKQELRCLVCIPEGIPWQPVEMSRETINEKLIRCPLDERGCDWTDTVSIGLQHLEECEFLPVLCTLKCVESDGERSGEVVRLERRQMAEHEREYCPQRELKCEFCGRAVRACEMNPHLGECEEFPVECPNSCEVAGETGTRQMKRGAVPLHLAECPLQRVKCTYWEYGCREEMVKRQLDLHEKEYIHTHFRLVMKGMKQKLIESDQLRAAQVLQANKIKCLETQCSELKNELGELKETISTLVSGRLEWKIKGVKQKIENKETSLSDPFYVGLYKCQVNIQWDFNNTGEVGCFIHIMKGEFDDKLKWPYVYRMKFVLLNQNRNENDRIWSYEITKKDLQKFPECFQRPTEIRNDCYGVGSFISNTEILTGKYFKVDSISLHITVEQLSSF